MTILKIEMIQQLQKKNIFSRKMTIQRLLSVPHYVITYDGTIYHVRGHISNSLPLSLTLLCVSVQLCSSNVCNSIRLVRK